MSPELAEELLTLRDVFRYAVSRFNAAGLSYGHGTQNAVDEAAFMLLESLQLPIDDINPWLDARLTTPERRHLLDLVEARVATRRPAPYLVGAAYLHGVRFAVDERVIVPRSYIADLLVEGTLGPDQLGLLPEPGEVETVLDLCTGSGALAIIAAMCFPNATVDATDLSADALEVARGNVASHGLDDRIALHAGDLFSAIGPRRYDLIVTNPPYVAEAEVAAFPAEYAAEPAMAHLGGSDGLDLVRRILADAASHLTPNGGLICEIGTGRDILEASYDLPFVWLDTELSEGEVFWLAARDLD